MNHDVSELHKFNALAESWWNPDGNFRFLHLLNPVRLEWIKKQISLKKKNVLDIGCGGGILTESLAHEDANVTGIDLAENAIAIAQRHSEKSGLMIRYLNTSTEELASREPDQYDVITCMELLEHVPDPNSIVIACSKLVKPGGYIFFSTLNRNIKSFFYAIIGAEYIMGLLPKGTHNFERFLTPAELSSFIRSSNMEVIALSGITSDLAARKFKLNKNIQVNYILSCFRPF